MKPAEIDWEAVYREYEGKVRSYIRSRVGNPEDIDDLCSEVFLQVMRGRDSFSGEPKAVSSWIYMITKHTVALHYRKERPFSEISEELPDETDLEGQVINREELDALADALELLDKRLRDIILLHYYDKKTLKEIAAAMNMSYPNMKVLHKRALEQLKKNIL